METYTYLGLSTVVERGRPDTGTKLTYIAQGTNDMTGDVGDAYVGLDRFGRVADQRWVSGSGLSAVDEDRYQYVYDRDSNPLGKKNVLLPGYSEKYSYDDLNRLSEFKRGTVSFSGSTVSITGTLSTQTWSLDALGNWAGTAGGALGTESRTHDLQNRLTGLSSTATGSVTLGYDDNGNLLADEAGHGMTYDAWNRMNHWDSNDTFEPHPRVTYSYDALGRMISSDDGYAQTERYYSKNWQVLEERVYTPNPEGSPEPTRVVKSQNVWSTVYVDALVARDDDATASTSGLGRKANGSLSGGLERRLYYQNDANFNVTALVSDSSNTVVERQIQTPYGQRSVLDGSWSYMGVSSAYGSNFGHQGGEIDAATGLVYFRNRWLSVTLGRWTSQDPAGWVDSMNLFVLYRSNPSNGLDPFGLNTITLNETTTIMFPPPGTTLTLPDGQTHTLQHGESVMLPPGTTVTFPNGGSSAGSANGAAQQQSPSTGTSGSQSATDGVGYAAGGLHPHPKIAVYFEHSRTPWVNNSAAAAQEWMDDNYNSDFSDSYTPPRWELYTVAVCDLYLILLPELGVFKGAAKAAEAAGLVSTAIKAKRIQRAAKTVQVFNLMKNGVDIGKAVAPLVR